VTSVAVGELEGRPLIVSGGDDGTVWMWELADGSPIGEPLTAHDGPVSAVAVGELDGRPVIVSGGSDRTMRASNLAGGDALAITVRSTVVDLASDGRASVVIAATAGLLRLQLGRPVSDTWPAHSAGA
jgi:WD40 repeat protein